MNAQTTLVVAPLAAVGACCALVGLSLAWGEWIERRRRRPLIRMDHLTVDPPAWRLPVDPSKYSTAEIQRLHDVRAADWQAMYEARGQHRRGRF